MNSRSVAQCITLGAGGGLLGMSLHPQWVILVQWETTSVAIAVAAVIAALLTHQPRWLQGLGAVGLVLFIGQQFVFTSVNFGLIGIALTLGCLAGLATSPALQCALGAGVLLGMTLDGVRLGLPRRYADYEQVQGYWSGAAEIAPLVLAGITLAALLWVRWPGGKQATAQVLAVCVALPLVVLLETQLTDSTLFTIAAALTLVVSAFLLPGRSGLAILAGGTIAITPLAGMFPTAVFALMLCAAIIAGLVLGRRWPQVAAGIALVALAVSPIVLRFDGVAALALLVGALGAAYAFASTLDVPSPVLAVAISVPFLPVDVPPADFGWTAYTPLTALPPTFAITANGWLPALIVGAYAATAFVLTRRR